jgi:hypothetical protein
MRLIESPTILKGRAINQTSGKRNSKSIAIGQHTINRKHHKAAARNSFIVF